MLSLLDTPYRAILFKGRLALPQNGAIPPCSRKSLSLVWKFLPFTEDARNYGHHRGSQVGQRHSGRPACHIIIERMSVASSAPWHVVSHRHICAIPHLYPILQHIARHLWDTPFKQARNSFARLSLQVSRDEIIIVAGPLC